MQEVDWTEVLNKVPGDPQELLVCSDWYEDKDNLTLAKNYRQRAEFWMWVEENNYIPSKCLHPRHYDDRNDLYLRGWAAKEWSSEENYKFIIPREIFILLPQDAEGDKPGDAINHMLYGYDSSYINKVSLEEWNNYAHKVAFQALYEAWFLWKEQQ